MTVRTIAENKALWDMVAKTDPNHTKQFKRGGGFSGTAINATYQVKKATEIFGPVGIGWGYEEKEHFVAEGVWFCKLEVWYKLGDERGTVEHWGATTFTGTNKNGTFVDEEAAKKSITDALGKCLSMLGFAADVYLGLYDDNKYVNDRYAEYGEGKGTADAATTAAGKSEAEFERIKSAITGGTIKTRDGFCKAADRVNQIDVLTPKHRGELLAIIRDLAAQLPDAIADANNAANAAAA